MVEYKELKLSADKTTLSIDLEVESPSYLGDIWIEYYPNRLPDNGRSSKAYLVRGWDGEAIEREFTGEVDESEFSLDSPGVEEFDRNLFYLMVEVITETSGEETTEVDVAAVIDWDWMFRVGMSIISNYASESCPVNCDEPKAMEQLVLVWHAFRLALEVKDLDMIDKLWGRFISLSSDVPGIPCNCK